MIKNYIKFIYSLFVKKSLFWSITLIITYLMQALISFFYVYSIGNFFQGIYSFYLDDKFNIIYPFLIFGLACFIKHIVDGINVFSINSFNKKIMSITKYNIMKKMESAKYKNFENIEKLNFLETIKNVRIDSILIYFFSIIFYYIPYYIILIIYLYNFNIYLGIISIFFFIPILILKILQTKFSDKFELQVSNCRRKRFLFMNYFFDLDIIKEIKLFSSNNFFLNLFNQENKKYINKKIEFRNKILKINFIFKLFFSIIYLSMMYILIKLTINNVVNLAVFSTALVLIGEMVFLFINMIVYDSDLIVENFASFKNYFKFYENKNYLDFFEKNENNNKNIVAKNVSFKYDNSIKNTLNNLTFTIKDKEKVVLVGRNGSGKTTLFKLLLGIYKQTDGFLEIVKNNSVVFQDYCRYKFNLKDNIIISDLDFIDENKFEKVYNFLELYRQFPDVNIELSPSFGGIYPSGGLWNNISIARCIYKDSYIYFMDEPMSNFDSIKEKEFFDKLMFYFKDKTLIFITHNLGIAKKFEKIILLNQGKIEKIGTHEELMKNEFYRELYFAQKNMYK